ncbi:hypothetical protein LTS18_012347, partial [Coniosporium uncinatum]
MLPEFAQDPAGPTAYHYSSKVGERRRRLTARKSIAKGTRMICEPPLLVLPLHNKDRDVMAAYDKLNSTQKSILVKTEWRSCGNRERVVGGGGGQLQPEKLHGTQLIDLVRSNVVPIQIVPKVLSKPQAIPFLALFPVSATLQHSCVPNVYCSWNPILECFTGHVVRDILEGAPLTADWIKSALMTNKDRVEKLGAMGVTCKCVACGNSVDRELSDERRTNIKRLYGKLRNESLKMNPVFGTRLVKVMEQLLIEEKLALTYPLSPYFQASHFSIQLHDYEGALQWAQKQADND